MVLAIHQEMLYELVEQPIVSNGLKVSKSQKQFMVSSILPKNEHWDNFMNWKLSQCSFFGRIEDTINCFRDLLTFNILFRKVFVIGINEAYDTAFLTFDVSMQTWTSTIISNMDFNIGR